MGPKWGFADIFADISVIDIVASHVEMHELQVMLRHSCNERM
nr:MAG TPA: hypothetical protein [Caudoviricetes sp.]